MSGGAYFCVLMLEQHSLEETFNGGKPLAVVLDLTDLEIESMSSRVDSDVIVHYSNFYNCVYVIAFKQNEFQLKKHNTVCLLHLPSLERFVILFHFSINSFI